MRVFAKNFGILFLTTVFLIACTHTKSEQNHRKISSLETDNLDALYGNENFNSVTFIKKIEGRTEIKDSRKSCLNKFTEKWKLVGVPVNEMTKPALIATTMMFPEANFAFDGMKEKSGKDLQRAQQMNTVIKSLSYAYFLADQKQYSESQIRAISLDVAYKKGESEFEKNIGGVFSTDQTAAIEFDRIFKSLNRELKNKGYHPIEDKQMFAEVMVKSDTDLAFCQDDSASPKQILKTISSNISFWTKETDLQNTK